MCNGCDTREAGWAPKTMDHLTVTLRGRFSVRHRKGRVAFDPTRAVLFPGAVGEYDTHHPDGGDECFLLHSPTYSGLLDPWQPVPIAADGQLRLHQLTARLARGPADLLEVEEALATVFDMNHTPPHATARARTAAEEIAHEVALHFDQALPLAALAGRVGLSIFAACRVFRSATGWTIHQYQLELRLRHALALLLETDRQLADIALGTGFANQGHFGNHFRRRYGVTPGSVRNASGKQSLAARLSSEGPLPVGERAMSPAPPMAARL